MKTRKMTLWFGALLFSLGMGCGSADSAASSGIGSDALAVTGGDVAGEQLALPDGEGGCARDRAGRVERSELDRLTSLLSLTEEQVAQIRPILDATRVAMEDLRAQVKSGALSAADAKAQVKALHDEQKAQITALLTPEQQGKFSALRKHHGGPFDVQRLTEVLGLSAEQVSAISELMTSAQTQISDVHAQVEAGTLSVDQAHAQIEQIHKATRDAIGGVLTAEQREELAQIMARPPRGPEGGRRPERPR